MTFAGACLGGSRISGEAIFVDEELKAVGGGIVVHDQMGIHQQCTGRYSVHRGLAGPKPGGQSSSCPDAAPTRVCSYIDDPGGESATR